MRKLMIFLMAAVLTVGCKKDDTDFSDYTNKTTPTTSIHVVNIVYNGTDVTVTGDTKGYVSTLGADVVVNTGNDTDSLLLVLSGSTTDGSLLVYRQRKYGIQLNGLTLNNSNGPAINNQCGKALYLHVADGTTNQLTDGTSYAEQTYDQKGALFSEGQMIILGTGTLSVTGNCKHAIACDDYIIVDENVTLQATSTTGNGIKVNDGLWINNGTINADFGISVAQHWSIHAAGRSNPWTFHYTADGERYRDIQYVASLGARWWAWYVYSGWWAGAKVQWANFMGKNILSNKLQDGRNATGLGLQGGYTLMLSKHLNLDFGLGVWGGALFRHEVYDAEAQTTRTYGGTAWFIAPDSISISLMYVF